MKISLCFKLSFALYFSIYQLLFISLILSKLLKSSQSGKLYSKRRITVVLHIDIPKDVSSESKMQN